MDVFPAEWKCIPTHTKVLALAVIPLVLGGVVCLHFSAGAAARTLGPDLIARNTAGDVLLGSRESLTLVKADGRISTLASDDLGLAGDVMSVSSDGTNWYIGEDGAGMLHRCDLVAHTCRPALQVGSGRRLFRRAHGVAFTDDRIYLTDSEAHRILAFDKSGRELAGTRTKPVALCFPNSIVAIDGDLYIADTNNFRIARIAESDISLSETFMHVGAGAPVQKANCNSRSARSSGRGDAFLNTAIDSSTTVVQTARPPARPDRVWLTSILRASTGDWWVIQQDNGMRMGDLIIYDESMKPRMRVPLPADSDPVDMIETSTGILVTDVGMVNVHRISLAGEVLGAWEAVRTNLDTMRQRRDRAMFWQYVSQAAIGIGALMAILVVILELGRLRRDGGPKMPLSRPTSHPWPLTTDIHWIGVEPKFLQRVKLARWFLFGLAAVYGLTNYWLFQELDGDSPLRMFFILVSTAMTIALFLAGVAFARHVKRLAGQRIGVSEREVLFDSGTGLIERSAYADVRVGPMNLLLGKRIITIFDQLKRPIYSKEGIENYLLARLPSQVFTKYPTKLMLEALRRGNVSMWFNVIGLLLTLVIVVIIELNPEWVKGMLVSLSRRK